MEAIRDMLLAMGEHVGDVGKGDAVLGAPIQLGSVTVYPVSRISVGLGSGGGSGDDACRTPRGHGGCATGTGGGAAGGMKARPVAVIVFSDEGVRVLPIPDKKCKIDGILDKIPELIDRIKDCRERA